MRRSSIPNHVNTTPRVQLLKYLLKMSLSVVVPIGIVGVDYKYGKRILICHLSDAVQIDLKVSFRDEFIPSDLKVVVDRVDIVPWEARPRKQDVGIRFSQDIDRELDSLFASNSHKYIISRQLIMKISV